MHALLASADSASAANTAYVWIYIVIGLFGTGIVTGLIAVARWLRNQGARDSKLDGLIDKDEGVVPRLERNEKATGRIEANLAALTKELRDYIERSERRFNHHVGVSEEVHRALWTAVGRRPPSRQPRDQEDSS